MSVIFGRVTDKNKIPIVNAKVRIIEGTAPYPEIIALTDEHGEYDIDYISAGRFTVSVEKEGYLTQKKTTKVGIGEEVRVDFVLYL
jgi:cephalosporin hydroxylase